MGCPVKERPLAAYAEKLTCRNPGGMRAKRKKVKMQNAKRKTQNWGLFSAISTFAFCILPFAFCVSAFSAPRQLLALQVRPRAAIGDRRRVPPSQRQARRRGGFSLLEVILALAILVAALAVLGELIRSGVRNAQMARDLSRAQVLCETKLSEVFAGVVPAEKTSNSAIAEAPGWLYSIERDASGPSGLIKVHVTVEQDPAQQRYPVKFTLAQWIRDPTITATQWSPPVSAASPTGSSSQGGTSSTRLGQ